MRLAFAVVALCCAAAAAAPLPIIRPHPSRGFVPVPHTADQNAAAVQQALHLSARPALQPLASLDPGAPYVANVAELDYANVASTENGPLAAGGPPHVLIEFSNAPGASGTAGFVLVIVRSDAEKHYAIDCRVAQSPTTPVNFDASVYAIGSPNTEVGRGTIQPDPDGHVLITVHGARWPGMLGVTLTQAANTGMDLYGCQISQF